MTDKATAIIRRLSSAFRQDIESNNYKIARIPADELDELKGILRKIQYSHYLDTAEGQSLDNIAELMELSRDGLSDADFRAMIGSTAVFRMSNGTLEDIKNVVSVLSGVDIDKITIMESYEDNAFSIRIEQPPKSDFTLTSFNKNVNSTKAAGVQYLQDILTIVLTPSLLESHVTREGAAWTIGKVVVIKYDEFIFGNSMFGECIFGNPCELHRTIPGTITVT